VPILGVCLGHQAIGAAFGGNVVRAPKLMHGKTSEIEHDSKTIFTGIPSPMTCTRYHSLIVAEAGLPDELEVSARTSDGETIMALRHRTLPIEGVQFHPESVLTTHGKQIIQNFLGLT
jgi:anthranilate synthase component 2